MKTKTFIMCTAALTLPLLANADGMRLQEHLNGLSVHSELIGKGINANIQLLKITSENGSPVRCDLMPGPSESLQDRQSAIVRPGQYSVLRVANKYTAAPLNVILSCSPLTVDESSGI